MSQAQPITVVGKTGKFSVELTSDELLEGDSIIATHMNGEPVKNSENGLQIIYSEATLKKYPHLKQRQYWWVRSFIVDDAFKPDINVSLQDEKNLKTILPWSMPYGVSSKGKLTSFKQRSGYFLDGFKRLRINLLNGGYQEIEYNSKVQYFMANSVGNKEGAYSLHQLIQKNGGVETVVANTYYLKSLEVIR